MNSPGEWTNAVKAAVIAVVNTFVALVTSIILLMGFEIDLQALAGVTIAIDAFVNAAAVLWILLTYRDSPARAQSSVLKDRGLKP